MFAFALLEGGLIFKHHPTEFNTKIKVLQNIFLCIQTTTTHAHTQKNKTKNSNSKTNTKCNATLSPTDVSLQPRDRIPFCLLLPPPPLLLLFLIRRRGTLPFRQRYSDLPFLVGLGGALVAPSLLPFWWKKPAPSLPTSMPQTSFLVLSLAAALPALTFGVMYLL